MVRRQTEGVSKGVESQRPCPNHITTRVTSLRPNTNTLHGDDDVDGLITNTLVGIKNNLDKPIQTAAPPDPNAPLWNMLKKIVLEPDDKMRLGLHLCKPEFQAHRGFLISMGQENLERWVYKF